MSSQCRGFLVSLFIHAIFISLSYVWFDAGSSMNKPLLIDLTLLGAVNELPAEPLAPPGGGQGLKKDSGSYQAHTERTAPASKVSSPVKRTSKPKNVSRPGKRIPRPKAVQKSKDPEKAAKAPAPQLQSATEPEGTVPTASPHADASTVSAAPPFQGATSGGYELSDAGPGGGEDSGQGLGSGAGGGGGDRGQGSGSGAGEGAGSKDGFLNKYLMEHFAYIRDIIQKKIIYPKMARRMGWEGKVIISFVILENGCATNIRIKESSGHSLLDDNVIKTVKAISPFPKPPVKSELLVPIVYRLEGT